MATTDRGERIHPDQPFFAKRRSGTGKGIDFTWQAMGPHGSPYEQQLIQELVDSSPPSAGALFTPDKLPGLRQSKIETLRGSLHGEILLEADYLGSIGINYRFLMGNENRFRLAVSALQSGSALICTDRAGNVGGNLDIELNAKLGGFIYNQVGKLGGHGNKKIRINAGFHGTLGVLVGGNVNFSNFSLTVFGQQEGQVGMVFSGPENAKLRGREIVVTDYIRNDERWIIVRDIPSK